MRKAAGDSARPYPELVIPPTVRRNKIDPMERLRMSPVENPEAQNPKAGKGTWLRRRMGIPSGIPLRDQNRAATALYTKVRTLSKQELDRPYTWYSTQGLTTDMINRVVAGMYKYSWDKRLARDVMMSICQRRCQNINRRENRARRAAGQEIKLGRRKTDYSATYDDPMDFVPTMKAPTYNDPNDKLIANMKDLPVNDPTDEILPNFRALPDNSPITTSAKQRKANSVDKILPNYRALPDNSPITWSAKQRGAKMGPIPYTATSQRKGRGESGPHPGRASPFSSLPPPPLPPRLLPSASRPFTALSGSRPPPIPSSSRPPLIPSSSQPATIPIRSAIIMEPDILVNNSLPSRSDTVSNVRPAPGRLLPSRPLGKTNRSAKDRPSATASSNSLLRYKALVNGKSALALFKYYDFQTFKLAIADAARISNTPLPSGDLAVCYRKNNPQYRHEVIIDDEIDYNAFLRRIA